jgi:hypothetical protein
MSQSAEWWRDYRARNRERLNRQQRERRAATPRVRGDRSAEYAKRASRAMPDMPALHVGHPLFDQAREIVGRRTGSLVTLYDTSYDDHIGAVVLALVEGVDPAEALSASRRFFTSWRHADIADYAA